MSYSQAKTGNEHFESMANGLGRAWAAKSIAESQYRGILNLLNKESDFEERFETYKQKWSTRKAAGENILIFL